MRFVHDHLPIRLGRGIILRGFRRHLSGRGLLGEWRRQARCIRVLEGDFVSAGRLSGLFRQLVLVCFLPRLELIFFVTAFDLV